MQLSEHFYMAIAGDEGRLGAQKSVSPEEGMAELSLGIYGRVGHGEKRQVECPDQSSMCKGLEAEHHSVSGITQAHGREYIVVCGAERLRKQPLLFPH
jgi:hypothetical protein